MGLRRGSCDSSALRSPRPGSHRLSLAPRVDRGDVEPHRRQDTGLGDRPGSSVLGKPPPVPLDTGPGPASQSFSTQGCGLRNAGRRGSAGLGVVSCAEQAHQGPSSVPAVWHLPPFPEGTAGPGLADKHGIQETLVLMWTKARPQRPCWKRETRTSWREILQGPGESRRHGNSN